MTNMNEIRKLKDHMDDCRRDYLVEVLMILAWGAPTSSFPTHVAGELGISVATLYRYLNHHGIDLADYLFVDHLEEVEVE